MSKRQRGPDGPGSRRMSKKNLRYYSVTPSVSQYGGQSSSKLCTPPVGQGEPVMIETNDCDSKDPIPFEARPDIQNRDALQNTARGASPPIVRDVVTSDTHTLNNDIDKYYVDSAGIGDQIAEDSPDLHNRDSNLEGDDPDEIDIDVEEGEEGEGAVSNDSDDGIDTVVKPFPLRVESLESLLLMTGAKRVGRDHYDMIRNISTRVCCSTCSCPNNVGEKVKKSKFPSTSTIQRVLRKSAEFYLYANSRIMEFPIEARKAGASGGFGSYKSSQTAPVMIVLPSDWARLDFKTTGIRNLIWDGQTDVKLDEAAFSNIEDCPIVMDRSNCLHPFSLKDHSGLDVGISEGMYLRVVCPVSKPLIDVLGKLQVERLDTSSIPEERVTFRVLVCKVEHVDDQKCVGDGGKDMYRDPRNLRNGDVVVHVSVTSGNAALIFRCLRYERGNEFAQKLVCRTEGASTFQSFPLHEAIAEPEAAKQSREKRDRTRQNNEGYLPNGTKYYVYRFLLYSDGFSPMHKKGSMDGCYIIPLGLNPDKRTFSGCLRRLWLAPPGISSRKVMGVLVDDVLKGTTVGFPVSDGVEKAVMFLDLVAYTADYPAITEMLDVKGHNAIAPCHLCFFKKLNTSGRVRSHFSYDPNLDSGNLSLRRSVCRCDAIRAAHVDGHVLKALGLKEFESNPNTNDVQYPSPFHELSDLLRRNVHKVPINNLGLPVVPCSFDAYRSCMVSPDHLFLGTGENIVNACLISMTPNERKLAECLAVEMIKDAQLELNRQMFNSDRQGLRPLKISEMYSLLLIFPDVFRTILTISSERNIDSRKATLRKKLCVLAQHFSMLVSTTLFRPIKDLDGLRSINKYNENGGRRRMSDLSRRSRSILSLIDEVCGLDITTRNTLDKPNNHRLIELFQHTIPSMGNIEFVLELVLERAHQDLKRAIKTSNFKNAQLQAMEHTLAIDWKNRIGLALDNKLKGSQLGLDTVSSIAALLNAEKKDYVKIQSIFDPVMCDNFKIMSSEMSTIGMEDVWVSNGTAGADSTEDRFSSTIIACHKFMEGWLLERSSSTTVGSVLDEHKAHLTHISSLRRMRVSRTRKKSQKREVIRCGSVVQVVCAALGNQSEDSPFEVIIPSDNGERTFFVCCSFFIVAEPKSITSKGEELEHSHTYAIVIPLEVTDEHSGVDRDSGYTYSVVSHDTPRHILRVTSSCRAVFRAHACWRDNGCVLRDNIVTHMDILDGGIYVLKGREEGYPTRRG